jgi:hypothetical protein
MRIVGHVHGNAGDKVKLSWRTKKIIEDCDLLGIELMGHGKWKPGKLRSTLERKYVGLKIGDKKMFPVDVRDKNQVETIDELKRLLDYKEAVSRPDTEDPVDVSKIEEALFREPNIRMQRKEDMYKGEDVKSTKTSGTSPADFFLLDYRSAKMAERGSNIGKRLAELGRRKMEKRVKGSKVFNFLDRVKLGSFWRWWHGEEKVVVLKVGGAHVDQIYFYMLHPKERKRVIKEAGQLLHKARVEDAETVADFVFDRWWEKGVTHVKEV